ncbi:hypothetical protein GCM10010228_72220 [Streptomyces massasporeus]|nr:hypothetical protein GCM10010228_72220 [Streptomyces massasporeus]
MTVGIRRFMTLATPAMLVVPCCAAPDAAAGPGEFDNCTAPVQDETRLFLTLRTGGDDLRGGGNNLDVTVHTGRRAAAPSATSPGTRGGPTGAPTGSASAC